MLDVLMIGEYDWANTGFRFSRCLRMLGIEALMIKSNYHPFMYPEQAIVHPEFMGMQSNLPSIMELMESAKVIHFIGSVSVNIPVMKDKRYIVQHGGSIYRENHKEINKYFNEFCDASIIQCPDLLNLGAKNEHLIYYPVDTDFIKPVYKSNGNIKIGHFPSNPDVKGTDRINKMVEGLKAKYDFEYITSTEKVSWMANLERMAQCDIIIETLQPELNGKKYGEWGNTALEGAALGKMVVTNSLSKDVYEKEYGENMLFLIDSEDMAEAILEPYLRGDVDLKGVQESTRKWAEEKHSLQATAQRLWEKIYKEMF